MCQWLVYGLKHRFLLDSGADVSVVNQETYQGYPGRISSFICIFLLTQFHMFSYCFLTETTQMNWIVGFIKTVHLVNRVLFWDILFWTFKKVFYLWSDEHFGGHLEYVIHNCQKKNLKMIWSCKIQWKRWYYSILQVKRFRT